VVFYADPSGNFGTAAVGAVLDPQFQIDNGSDGKPGGGSSLCL
jgi:hypothetical protein